MPRRTFAEALFFGFKDYVDELPPTSPARKILLKIALEHADVKSVSHYFEFSETTVRKANCEEDDFIKAMKSPRNHQKTEFVPVMKKCWKNL